MRIYLDNCVYQDLKREENKALYNTILESKKHHIYLFSEAHLFDLARDSSDEKYSDMNFMESICENNCLERNGARRFTPKEYYNRYDWDGMNNYEEILDFFKEDPLANSILQMFNNTPLPFNEVFKDAIFSNKYPEKFKDIFTQTTNLGEFMELGLELSESMNDHSHFKGILQGGREVELTEEYYNALGIYGFDGNKITDKERFKESYTIYSEKFSENTSANKHDKFVNKYLGLEILNIVKGKPRKQQFPNLKNDAKHAYFGAQCDIVISKDADFITKTKFLYDVFDINTYVVSLKDFNFEDIIITNLADDYNNLLAELSNFIEYLNKSPLETEKDCIGFNLEQTHLGYFNLLYRLTDTNNRWTILISKKADDFKNNTLIKEIEFVCNTFVSFLGKDTNGKDFFKREEIADDAWSGRLWTFGETSLHLNFRNLVEIYIYNTNLD